MSFELVSATQLIKSPITDLAEKVAPVFDYALIRRLPKAQAESLPLYQIWRLQLSGNDFEKSISESFS